MTTTQNTTAPATLRGPVAIVYEVQGPRKPYRVTVTRSERSDPSYDCSCGMACRRRANALGVRPQVVALYGDCQHAQAVRAERQKQGRR